MSDSITLYGISHCDKVKAARSWLTQNNIAHEFIDFRKQPPTTEIVAQWLQQHPEALINKRSTTWRQLTKSEHALPDTEQQWLTLLLEQPTLMKRPILVDDSGCQLGFNPKQYEGYFNLA